MTPSAGDDGWYSDRWNGGRGGAPAWETFHTQELVQLLERNWGASDRRVVAGLSMGGYGAMVYAAQHPGLFRAAASYSGVLEIIDSGFDGNPPQLWGDRTEQAEVWAAHDPTSLADGLAGIPLYVSYGDGNPGPLDPDAAAFDGGEAWISGTNRAFVTRLGELGIDATVDAYGRGTHDWPYWERALHDSLPMLLDALGEPVP